MMSIQTPDSQERSSHSANSDYASDSRGAGDPPGTPPPTPPIPIKLLQPAASRNKRASKPIRVFRAVRSAFRSFPIISPTACRLPSGIHYGLSFGAVGHNSHDGHISGATRMTGTLFGQRKAKVTLSVQDTPRSVPLLVLELAMPTGKLLQEMGAGLVRVALECEKKPLNQGSPAVPPTKLLEEPVWSMYCNGRKLGYGTKREPNEGDLRVMQLLHGVSMGAGVLPSADPATEAADGELTYMRAHFDRVVGSKDSETFYMLNPDGNSGPELTIFFVRI